MNDAQEKPRRRWYQFRLSTWFVLVAILAWAMIEWPFYEEYDPQFAKLNYVINNPADPFGGYFGLVKYTWFWKAKLSLERLVFPAFALAAFVCWKAVWLVVERRHKQVADPK